MSFSTLSTITLLLATIALLVRACPLSSDCNNECEAYKYAKNSTEPRGITIEATLSDLTNDLSDFKSVSNLSLEEYTIEEQNACYYRTEQTKGCTQNLLIGDDRRLQCSWTYQCDYNQNRIPQYLWRADCDSNTSVTVNYTVPVLKRESCNPLSQWQLVIEEVPVACAC